MARQGTSQGKFPLEGRGSQRDSTVDMRSRSARQLTRKPVKDRPGRRFERNRTSRPSVDEAVPAAEGVPPADSASTSACGAAGADATRNMDPPLPEAAPQMTPRCPARGVNIAPVGQSSPANELGDSPFVQRCHAHEHAHAHAHANTPTRTSSRSHPSSNPHHVATLSPHLSASYPVSSLSRTARLR
jgi:hypothetical protein